MRSISRLIALSILIAGNVFAAVPSSQVLNDSTVLGPTAQSALNNLNPRNTVNVSSYCFDLTGGTDCTAVIATALSLVPNPGVLYFPCGTYTGSIHPVRGQLWIKGESSTCVTIKAPVSSTWAAQPEGGVVEYNSVVCSSCTTYDGMVISGLTIDGQRSLQPNPPTSTFDDIHGWCILGQNVTHLTIKDVRAQNCPLAGIGVEGDSDYAYVQGTIESSGTTQSGYGYPCYDNNTASNQIVDLIINNCVTGARLLDNIYGAQARFVINNPQLIGFILTNEPGAPFPPTPPKLGHSGPLQANYANNLDVTVIGGSQYAAAQIGVYPNNFNLKLTTQGVAGIGLQMTNGGGYGVAHGCKIDLNTYQSGGASFDGDLNGCVVNVISEDDNYLAPPFSAPEIKLESASTGNKVDYTVIRSGTYNSTFSATTSGTTLTVSAMCTTCYGGGGYINVGQTVIASGIPAYDYIVSQLTSTAPGGALGGTGTYQLSAAPSPAISSTTTMNTQVSVNDAMSVLTGALGNEISGRQMGASAQLYFCGYLDQNPGTTTTNRFLTSGYGGVLMSGNPMNIPENGDDFQVSGTAALADISGCMYAGRRVTLHFQGITTVGDISGGGSNNVQLTGHKVFKTYPGATLMLETDGTYWYEVSRSQPVLTPLYSNVAMTSGGSYTMTSYLDSITLQGSGTIAAYTLVLPSNTEQGGSTLPDGTLVKICTDVAVTALTVNASAGQTLKYAPSGLTAGQCFGLRYTASGPSWDIGN